MQVPYPPARGQRIIYVETLAYTRKGQWRAQIETCAEKEKVRLLVTHGIYIEWVARVPEQYALSMARTIMHQKSINPAPLLDLDPVEEGRL